MLYLPSQLSDFRICASVLVVFTFCEPVLYILMLGQLSLIQ